MCSIEKNVTCSRQEVLEIRHLLPINYVNYILFMISCCDRGTDHSVQRSLTPKNSSETFRMAVALIIG